MGWINEDILKAKLARVREREGLAKDHCTEMYRRPGHQRRMDLVAELLHQYAPNVDFLDVGCAEGVYCGMAMDCGAHHVVGLDISSVKLAHARQRYSTAKFHRADIFQLSNWGGSSDLVLCSEVLQHVPDYLEACRSVLDCVRSGGRVIFTVPNLTSGVSHIPATVDGSMSVDELLDEIGGAGFGRQNALWKFNTEILYREIAEQSGVTIEQVVPVDTPDGERCNLWTIGLFRVDR